MMRICTVFLALLFLYPNGSSAQKGVSKIYAAKELSFQPVSFMSGGTSPQAEHLYIIHLSQALNEEVKQQLERSAFRIIQPFADNKWMILAQENKTTWPVYVKAFAPFTAYHKMSASLSKNWENDKPQEVVLGLDKVWMSTANWRSELSALGLKIINSDHAAQQLITVKAQAYLITLSLEKPFILNAGIPTINTPLTREVTANNGSYFLQNTPLYNNLLQGDSVVLGIGDSYTSLGHTDLKDRTVNFNFLPPHLHGILTSGVMAGAGNINPKARGVAPHSTIINQAFNRIWAEAPNYFGDFGMTLTNNSYASVVGNCTLAGSYDIFAQALDEMALNYPELLHVFAAGNDGNMVCSGYPAGYANIPGGYQVAKNVLTVGMTYKWLQLHNSSSRGPVNDGRLKPELVSIGGQVFGPSLNEGYIQTSGTSLSCPSVVGGLGLLTQRYRHLNNSSNPKSDVLKAILLATTSDLGKNGPDYFYGYGMMNLRRAMESIENQRYFRDSVQQAGLKSFTINVPAGVSRLKVMLYYNDLAANPAANKQLINDLDLQVITPNASTFLPLILPFTPSQVADTAAQGIDTVNNSEMVIIDNPIAGTYAIKVLGSSISNSRQAFAVAFDWEMEGIQFIYPTFNTAVPNNDSLRIYWEAGKHANAFTLEFSDNNGINWTVINNAISSNAQSYSWWPPVLNSAECLLRLSRNGTALTTTSQPFVINTQPIIALNTQQCPGYIHVKWESIPNATAYEVWLKRGAELSFEQTISSPDTSALIGGLQPDKSYWVAVYPRFGAAKGCRSIAIERTPNSGNCSSSIIPGDLSVKQWIAPGNGRALTPSALSNSEVITVQLVNNSNVAASNFELKYSINNSSWTTLSAIAPIPAAGTINYNIPSINFSAVLDYSIVVVINNLATTDPFSMNDTLRYVVRQLPNPPVNIISATFKEDFETNTVFELDTDSMGWSANTRWDYFHSTDTGRLRTFCGSANTINGIRSLSMDSKLNNSGTANFSTLTLNLSNLDTALHEVRMSFEYRIHGRPKTADSNTVWVRGSSLLPWLVAFRYDTSKNHGTVEQSGSISLTQLLKSGAQPFTSDFEVRFGQNDTSAISGAAVGNGVTLDNIEFYTVSNDIFLSQLIAPATKICGQPGNTPVIIRVKNTAATAISGATASYQFDGGSIITELLPLLPANDSVDFTFSNMPNLSALGNHQLSIWVDGPLDSYSLNDSLLNIPIRIQPIINNFPYLENFELSDGWFYAQGVNSSWDLGTPAGIKIQKAASGIKAWKTGLAGHHNDMESSFLYSPCFDLSMLSNPMLSFSHVVDVENCGSSLCDQSYMEYSSDGQTWQRLGANGQGTNWYNNSTHQAWIDQNNTRWRVATIALPISNTLQLRWILKSDVGASMEGIGVDDVHIYDFSTPIYSGASTPPVNSAVNNTQFQPATQGGALLSGYRSDGASNNLQTTQYLHSNLVNPVGSQYFFPRSFVVQAASPLSDSLTLRLYLPDQDFITMQNDISCSTCTKPEDIYAMGITKFTGTSLNENGSLSDNAPGLSTFIPPNKIQWVPFSNGYYAQLKVGSLSEFWFNDGGPTQMIPLPLNYVEFNAKLIAADEVECSWTSIIDTDVKFYVVEISADGKSFQPLDTIVSSKLATSSYVLNHKPDFQQSAEWFYRLRWQMDNGNELFSTTKKIMRVNGAADMLVFPNPVEQSVFSIQWTDVLNQKIAFTIRDVTGKLIAQKSWTSNQFISVELIETNGWPRGIYFVHSNFNSITAVKKIVIN